jgi:hypothetical protein
VGRLLTYPANTRRKNKMIKKEFKYIRYKICRSIYYADQCPVENRKNINNIIKNFLGGLCVAIIIFIFIIVAGFMA